MSKKILIVEDDLFLGELISKKLSKSDFEVIHASNANDGLDILSKDNIDLILLDLLLPEVSGFDFLKKVREDGKHEKLPVLVFSNLAEERDVKQAMDLGATDFLVKSNYTLDDVEKRIRALIGA